MSHSDETSGSCPSHNAKERRRKGLWTLGILAAVSGFWIALRSGSKPSRIVYPCQQVALSNIQVFKVAVLALIPNIGKVRAFLGSMKPVAILATLIVGTAFLTSDFTVLGVDFALAQEDDFTRVPLDLTTHTSTESISDLYIVQNAMGEQGNMDSSVSILFDMMESEGLNFYRTASAPSGLIGSDDVVILKVNGQWGYRGGTNTDLVKSVISAIGNHPDGYTGEVVVADNGQGLGNLDFYYANSYYHNQSLVDIVNSFDEFNVSTFLWDTIRSSTVDEYSDGDLTDGYVLNSTWTADTEIFTSYPKFRTTHGVYISFRNGVWDSESGYDSDRLKVINMPVLKSHFRYGVTGSVKNYMGLPKGHIVGTVDPGIPHEHFSIALGGMATLMVQTRAPVLNILDMLWVNAHPMESSTQRGPWSRYNDASFTDIIGASLDPIALDYWASKNVLCGTADYLNYSVYSSLSPDYEPLSNQYYGPEPMDESFHNYLERSMNVLIDAGHAATMDEAAMNVYVVQPALTTTTGTTTPTEPPGGVFDLTIAMALILPISAAGIVLVAVMVRRRNA
ncbi:MAG: DUF362 domain-containing protein [Candidatus Thorarchaeota archaeon]|jgi:hypothetical protein